VVVRWASNEEEATPTVVWKVKEWIDKNMNQLAMGWILKSSYVTQKLNTVTPPPC